MTGRALTVCQGDMLARLERGKYYLVGAYKPEECAARKNVIKHLLDAGLVRGLRNDRMLYGITEDGRVALADWREANKTLLDQRRKEFWARTRALECHDKNKGECDVVS